jgi:tetratricopeptide (TPR) repeat protein
VPESLDAQLDRIVAARDRDDMAPTIAALLPLLEQHPDDARVLYEVGGAYDTAGEEATALDLYERAEAAGLAGDLLRRCYLQHGSTLRNLGRVEESRALFARARAEFPGSSSLAVFEVLTLHAAGRPDAALASALRIVADHVPDDELQRYLPAIRGNAAYLDTLDAPAETP